MTPADFIATRDGLEYRPPLWRRTEPVIRYVLDVSLRDDDLPPTPAAPALPLPPAAMIDARAA